MARGYSAQSSKTDYLNSIDKQYFIALLPIVVLAVLFYGNRVLYNIAAVSIICYIVDLALVFLRTQSLHLKDISSTVLVITIAMVMPASISFNLLLTASLFAIIIVKHPFGGRGNSVFSLAAAGFAFVLLNFPAVFNHYPVPFDHTTAYIEGGQGLYVGTLTVLNSGAMPTVSIFNMLIGNLPSAMGAGFVLVSIAAGIYLAFQKRITFTVVLSFLSALYLISAIFNRTDGFALQAALYEILGGYTVFGAIFFASPVELAPRRLGGRIIYGIVLAMLTVMFRNIGYYNSGLCFAVLIANSLINLCDRASAEIYVIYSRVWRGANG